MDAVLQRRIQVIAEELRGLASSPKLEPEAAARLRSAAQELSALPSSEAAPPAGGNGRASGAVHTVGIAVRDLTAARRRFEAIFDAPLVREAVHAEEGSEWVWYQLGPIALELIAPTGPESRVQRFLDRRGEGLFLVSLVVSDMADAIKRFREAGLEVIYAEGRRSFPGGVNNFIHPKSFFGTLLEFRELNEGTT